LGEIEEPIPCRLCCGERVRALFRTGTARRLYAGQYSRFLTGEYANNRQRRPSASAAARWGF
jgi:hypothetical protein